MRAVTGTAALAIAAALLTAAPAAAADAQQLYRDGVAARHAGDAERAIDLLGACVAAEPRNADAQLQLGLAFSAAGRDSEAEAALRRTLEIAPGYDDARIALARIAQRRGDRAAAAEALAQVAPGNAEAATLRAKLAAGATAYRWRVDVDGSYSAVGSGRSDWKDGSVQLRYQRSADSAVAIGLETSSRFGHSDTYGEVRLDQRLSNAVTAYVTAGGTPNADFRPEWQIGAGGSAQLRSGPAATVVTVDARQAHFEAGDIQTVSPGVEQYVAGGRAWLSGRWINIFDERGHHRSGWLARGDLLASERLRLFAGVADAPDVSEGVVVDTFSLFGGVSADLSQRLSLRLSLGHENRESGADRTQIGVGAGFRF